METTIINAISNVGFPIVVAVYLLMRLEKVLERFSTSFIDLTKIIEKYMDTHK